MIEQSQITFDDENGITIIGYMLNENDEWVAAISPETQSAMDHFDTYGYNYSDLTFSENGNGQVAATDSEGDVVYEDGKFSLDYAVEQAGQLDLMKTNIEPDKTILEGSGQYVPDNNSIEFAYIGPLCKRVRVEFEKIYGFDPYVKGKTAGNLIMLNPKINAWGANMTLDFNDPEADRYLYYELADGTIHIVPLL